MTVHMGKCEHISGKHMEVIWRFTCITEVTYHSMA